VIDGYTILKFYPHHSGMDNMSKIKFLASQAKTINNYKNRKMKLLLCCANIYFNKQCLIQNLTPSYARIKVANTSPAAKLTQLKVQTIRIKDELRFLYKKKALLNKQLYYAHLLAANTWGKTWNTIADITHSNISKNIEKKYQSINQKLHALQKKKEIITKTNQENTQIFHPRVVNLTNITFNKTENALLQKGLKYNLHVKPKNWLKTIALEAETAINYLATEDKHPIRYLVAKSLDKLSQETPHSKSSLEYKTLKNIREKLEKNNSLITRADKGQTIIVVKIDDYNSKIHDFLQHNSFKMMSGDPTNIFTRETKKIVNSCKTIIPHNLKWKYNNMNPHPPSIRALMKIHKPDIPIRPVINWQHAPAYKIAKLLSEKLQQTLQLPFAFNIQNSLQLMHELKNTIPYNDNLRLASFDISNMYTNIPTNKIPTIITEICKNLNTSKTVKNELIKLTRMILKQNYFNFQNITYKQTTGLAMGAPTSAIFSEIYLQYIEHTLLIDILSNNHIIGYFRYVDDILLIYDIEITNINKLLEQVNNTTPNLNFTIETEQNNMLNFLDITIHRNPKKFEFSIYRKPTVTNHIIPKDSCHPPSHKLSAIRFLTDRMHTYPISEHSRVTEANNIKHILQVNKYDTWHTSRKHTKPKNHSKTSNMPNKRALFTYFGRETTKITNIFQKLGIQIAFQTKHTIGKLLQNHHKTRNKFQNNGVYELACPDCNKRYIGQTGRPFAIRFKEHERDFQNNCKKSLFAKHLIEQQHHFPPIDEGMSILEIQRKSKKLHTLEQFHIYKAVKSGDHLNEQYTDTHNEIFESVLKHQSQK